MLEKFLFRSCYKVCNVHFNARYKLANLFLFVFYIIVYKVVLRETERLVIIMNISSVSSYNYNSARQVQKINFGEISMTPYVKRVCGISSDDNDMLNDKCPKELHVLIRDTIIGDNVKQLVRADITYNDEKQSYNPEFYVNFNDNHSYVARQENKQKFMDCVNEIIERYKKQ